ncbi:hypothetical protein ACO0QE_001693 [Hanseniaspora vineae]
MSELINSFKDINVLSESLYTQIASLAKTSIETHGKFKLAISGGSLIKVLNLMLVTNENDIDWKNWEFWFCDERCVPLKDADSNYGEFAKNVLDKLNIEKHLLPTVYTINESLVASKNYDELAKEYAELLPSDYFDVILLGCGPDGHTCSMFPGEAHKYLIDNPQHAQVLHCADSPKPPSDRITFTLDVLDKKARNLWFVAMGSSKLEIFEKIFIKKDTSLPCALINEKFSNKVQWFVDDDAVKGLF